MQLYGLVLSLLQYKEFAKEILELGREKFLSLYFGYSFVVAVTEVLRIRRKMPESSSEEKEERDAMSLESFGKDWCTNGLLHSAIKTTQALLYYQTVLASNPRGLPLMRKKYHDYLTFGL